MTELLLESQPAFDQFIAGVQDAPLIAVDTEAASFHRYNDRIYLIQMSSRDRTAVIDPLAIADLSALGALLANPAVETVFHDADYDLRILHRDLGFTATNLFDTRIAAQLLNEPGIGLAALLQKHFGLTLDKKYQRADWSIRPLQQGMLEYAAADTRHLPELRDIIRRELEEKGRWSWAAEEFALLERVRWSPPGPPEEAYLRIKGARTLRGHQYPVLRELYEWREAAARQLDRAPFRVLQNESMVAIAKALPADETALRELKALSPDQLRRRGAEILAAVARGVNAPPESIPKFERPHRQPPDLAYEARLERLKQARNSIADELPLAPGVLCPNGLLEAIARLEPRQVEDLGQVEGMRRWQREVVGERLIGAMVG